MNLTSKINHWVLFISFLGLIATSLAADFFFSKEAIMDSFKISTPQLGLTISPVDQLFMARIARRITWDWHLYSGILFTLSMLYVAYRVKDRLIDFKDEVNITIFIMIISGFVLSISGIWMFLRLYYPLTEDMFQLLKVFHNYSKWIFMASVVFHIYFVVRNHNKKSEKTLSNMFKR